MLWGLGTGTNFYGFTYFDYIIIYAPLLFSWWPLAILAIRKHTKELPPSDSGWLLFCYNKHCWRVPFWYK